MLALVNRLLNENQRLFIENSSLHCQVGDFTTQCTNMQNQLSSMQDQLASLVAVPRLHQQTAVKNWHQQARIRVNAVDSRGAPTNAYNYAHSGCTWRNKKVTLQGYILHLQRKHSIKVSENPDLSYLPVLET